MIVGSPLPRRRSAGIRAVRPVRRNPPSAVKTARDEYLWERAKEQAEVQIARSHVPPTDYHAYVMGIYQSMKSNDLARDVKKLNASRKRKAASKPRRNPQPTAEQQARKDVETALKGSGFVVDNSGKSGEYADVQLSNGLIVAVCVKPAARTNPKKAKASKKAKSSRKAKKVAPR